MHYVKSIRNLYAYTISELLVVLFIMVIILGSAIPIVAHQVLQHNNDVAQAQLKALVHYAQSEAMRISKSLIICAAEYDTSALGVNTYLNNCASTNAWNEGVLLFYDLNANNNYTSGERLKALRFDGNMVISAVTSPGAIALNRLIVNEYGLITDNNSSEQWIFSFSQTKLGSSLTTQLRLNKFGYFCKLGDSGC